jgi:hypothetical protein
MPDDHSKLVPLLPIPNRTVKRLSADDSADSRVKVGHRQALTARNARSLDRAFSFSVDIDFLFALSIVQRKQKTSKKLTRLQKPVYNLRLS